MSKHAGWRLAFVVTGLLLLLGPLFVRTMALGYNRRPYAPVETLSSSSAATPQPTAVPLPQAVVAANVAHDLRPGPIIVDFAHGNNVDRYQFESLAAALALRGLGVRYWTSDIDPMTVTNFLDYPDQSNELASLLRSASGLVTVSPFFLWSKAEIALVEQFVADGGRVLLVSDPDVVGDLAQDINGLGEPFGIVFTGDYLYDTLDNDGNHTYVYGSEFAGEAEPLAGSRIAFYGVRSISGDVTPLVRTGDTTVSNLRPGLNALSTVVKGGQASRGTDGGVLAMGDFDVLTAPFLERHDNARLTDLVADFLATGTRTQGVTDFPAYLGKNVTLVLANAAAVDAQTLAEGSRLQESLRKSGRTLAVAGSGLLTTTTSAKDDSQAAGSEGDMIVLADFAVADAETELLDDLGFTLVEVTPTPLPTTAVTEVTETTAEAPAQPPASAQWSTATPRMVGDAAAPAQATATTAAQLPDAPSNSLRGRFTSPRVQGQAQPAETPAPPFASTATFTPAPTSTAAPPTVTPAPTATPTAEPSPTPEPEVYLVAEDGLRLLAADTVLISQRELPDGRRLVAVLANNNEGIRSGIDRLLDGRFIGCVTRTDLAVCSDPNGEGAGASMAEAAGTATPTATDAAGASWSGEAGEKLVMVIDDNDLSMPGEESEADLYLKVLTRQGIGPTLWTTAADGIPNVDSLTGYDWVIWSSGGYESGGPGLADLDGLLGYINGGGSLTISSRRPFFGMSAKEESAIADVAVDDDLPPMVRGLPSTAVSLRNGLPPVTPLEIGEQHAGAKIVLQRGPESSDAGAPLLYVVVDDQGDNPSGAKLMIGGMSLTWLPEEYGEQLVRNMIGYMAGE